MNQLFKKKPPTVALSSGFPAVKSVPDVSVGHPMQKSLQIGLQLNNLAWSTDDPKALAGTNANQPTAESLNPTLSALFKRYVNVLLENGEYFLADGEMSKDLATSLLQEQIKVTEELFQKIQGINEAEFKQFVKFADLRPTTRASINNLSQRSESDDRRAPNFTKSLGSIGRNLSILGLSANFNEGPDYLKSSISPGLGVGWPGGFTSIPKCQLTQQEQLSKTDNGRLVLTSAQQFCDFQSTVSKH